MKRFYLPFKDFETESIFDLSFYYHKIINVLRLTLQSEILLYNGEGKQLVCSISKIDNRKKKLFVSIVREERESNNSIKITLIQSLIKKAKLEIAIQKAVELGVDKIFLLYSERTVAHCSELNFERLNSIISEACSQCGRAVVPLIYKPVDWKALSTIKEGNLKFAGSLNGDNFRIEEYKLLPPNSGFQLVVGPEGGFSKEEEKSLTELSYKLIRLNNNTMRSETASLNMLSIFSYLRDVYLQA